MTPKKLFTIISYIFIFAFSIYISWIYAIPSLVFSLAIYSILTYFLYALFKKLFDKSYIVFNKENYKNYLNIFLYKVATLIVLCFLIIWGFAYYQNELSPAIMPVYTLTNWNKTVVFHTMSHIWTPNFYQNVKNSIEKYKKDDFTYYFEWVKPGSKENQEKFDKALWIKLDKNTYSTMSKLYWLVNQDNSIFLNLVNNKDINVDVNIDEIVKKYDELKIQNWNQNRVYNDAIDINKELTKELSKLTPKELELLRYINKSFINVIVKNKEIQNTIQNEFANQELFDVILNQRNKIIAEKIISSDDKKIIATYGMLHFDWIYNILKQNDIKWQITKIDYLYPLK